MLHDIDFSSSQPVLLEKDDLLALVGCTISKSSDPSRRKAAYQKLGQDICNQTTSKEEIMAIPSLETLSQLRFKEAFKENIRETCLEQINELQKSGLIYPKYIFDAEPILNHLHVCGVEICLVGNKIFSPSKLSVQTAYLRGDNFIKYCQSLFVSHNANVRINQNKKHDTNKDIPFI